LRFPLKALLAILAAGLLYILLTPILQKALFLRLEKGGEISIQGKNLSPFTWGFVHLKDATISKPDLFTLTAKDARINFSPVSTLLGQIPLTIRAKTLTVSSQEKILNSAFSSALLDTLDAKITVFSGKGIAIHRLEIDGSGIKFSSKGKLVKKGKGNSDLSASLWVDPAVMGENFQMLTQDLFLKNTEKTRSNQPTEFKFRLTGDLSHPTVDFQSDLIQFGVREKEVTG
jgi:hypothetical protein